MTWHMTEPSFVYWRWASLCAQGSSDWWLADLPQGNTFYIGLIIFGFSLWDEQVDAIRTLFFE